jgi:hypothetical protein
MRNIPLVIALLAFATLAPAAAALPVTASGTPPAEGLLLSLAAPPDRGGYLIQHGTGADTSVGQTFRLTAPGRLEAITILFTPETEIDGEQMTFRFGTLDDAGDVTFEDVLQVDLGTLPDLDVGEAVYLTFDLADLDLQTGRQYGFELGFEGGGGVSDARARVHHLGDGDEPYAGGLAFRCAGAFCEPLEHDLVFFLQGDAEGPQPEDDWFTDPDFPDFRFQVRITDQEGEEQSVREEEDNCLDEAACVSGALPGRVEAILRIIGPRPNGYLWPMIVKLTPSRVEVWIEQLSTGQVNYYLVPAAAPGNDDLGGFFDRTGFLP